MKLAQQLKTALNDNRLLILGAQVLFGFQFNAVFQEMFEALALTSRAFACGGIILLTLTIGLLITPSMHHRIVERGQDSACVLRLATVCAGWALVPLSIALAGDFFIALERVGGTGAGLAGAFAFFVLAAMAWYGLGLWLRAGTKTMPKSNAMESAPLDAQVDQLLTEARVIIPGAQALLGLQLAVTLTRAFAELPPEAKIVHAAAFCCVGVAIILLMAPASLHRIAYGGQDDTDFVRIGSYFVIAAPLPLALGIAFDSFVATLRAFGSTVAAGGLALAAIITLLGFWYAFPLWRRLGRT